MSEIFDSPDSSGEARGPDGSPPTAPPTPSVEPLSFTGEGGEYFRIWIVNLALTVVTLGIYSAWAKVRRVQYFYRHTRLAGSSFDYHGEPIAILKGRIVALGLFAIYTGAGMLGPWTTLAGMALIAAVLPWLLCRSLRFRLHNSSYRGLRFRFHGSTGDAYKVFLGLPVLTILTLGLLAPFTHHRIKHYQHEHAAFGRTRFAFTARVSEFYVFYLIAAALSIATFALAMVVLLGGLIGAMFGQAGSGGDLSEDFTPALPALALFMVVYVIGVLAVQAFVLSRTQNVVWAGTHLAGHRFQATVRARSLFGILLGNLLGTVLSLGLYRPFAQIKLARYLASTFVVLPAGSLADFVADEQPSIDAAGEEAADLFDFDIAF